VQTESPRQSVAELNQPRPLREDERALIDEMLAIDPIYAEQKRELQKLEVVDMQDGGMGSIKFVRTVPQKYGKTLAEAKYMDDDGVPVLISINADREEKLMEVDFWKVDFSRLRTFPKPSQLIELRLGATSK
jgi:hypothetical protein